MKKFRILGIISIIAMVVGIAINFDDGLRSFNEGRKEGENSYKSIPDNLYRVSLEVVPIEGTTNAAAIHLLNGEKFGSAVSSYLPPKASERANLHNPITCNTPDTKTQ